MGFLFDGIFSPMRKCFSAGTIKIFCRLLWKRRLANAVHVNVLERCVLASSEQAMSGSSEEKLRLKKKKRTLGRNRDTAGKTHPHLEFLLYQIGMIVYKEYDLMLSIFQL